MAEPKYDQQTADMLFERSLPYREDSTRVRSVPAQNLPSNAAGIPNLLVREMPYLAGTNTRGFVMQSNRIKDEMLNRGLQPNVFVSPDAGPQTVAHETEHLLARQNAGFATKTRDEFLNLLGSSATSGQRKFLEGLKDSLPYLQEKYGIKNGYMDPKFIDRQGGVGLYEIFATLAGAEAALGVDLTKDPELRKNMFSDRKVREAYNAVTGLRQTRLDPRDIPPYTRVEEPPEPGVMGKLKHMLGLADGGLIDKPLQGGSKLI